MKRIKICYHKGLILIEAENNCSIKNMFQCGLLCGILGKWFIKTTLALSVSKKNKKESYFTNKSGAMPNDGLQLRSQSSSKMLEIVEE